MYLDMSGEKQFESINLMNSIEFFGEIGYRAAINNGGPGI
jgi:hypothetical protein